MNATLVALPEDFSAAEYARRYATIARLCEAENVDALVVYGTSANARQGQAQVHYLTGFLGHQEACVVLVPDKQPILFVQYFNHVPHASRVAHADVRWGGPQSVGAVADEVGRLPGGSRIGLVGPIPFQAHRLLTAQLGDQRLVDVSPAFKRLRLIKSEEELAVMRRAAGVTDAALRALVRAAAPGATELDLQAAATAAAIKAGGQPHFLYLSSTPMAEPDRIVPQQDLSDRMLAVGDLVMFELSAAASAYSGQVLRTIAIGSDLTAQYRRMHELAWKAFHAIADVIGPDVPAQAAVDAGALIEQEGFTICDNLVHGYGGGYLPPVLRTPKTAHGPVPDLVFQQNMTLVIQPNVVERDGRAGVQVGELVRVTSAGVETLHQVPQRLLIGGELI